MAEDLSALQTQIDSLEARKAELEPVVLGLREENARLESLLAAVARGVLFGISRWKLGVALLLCLGAAAALIALGNRDHRESADRIQQQRRLQRTIRPHVLVTSEPGGAQVMLNGAPALGKTPLIHEAPANGMKRFVVELWMQGYRRATRTVTTTPGGGVHLHVVLERDFSGADANPPGPQARRRTPESQRPGSAS